MTWTPIIYHKESFHNKESGTMVFAKYTFAYWADIFSSYSLLKRIVRHLKYEKFRIFFDKPCEVTFLEAATVF